MEIGPRSNGNGHLDDNEVNTDEVWKQGIPFPQYMPSHLFIGVLYFRSRWLFQCDGRWMTASSAMDMKELLGTVSALRSKPDEDIDDRTFDFDAAGPRSEIYDHKEWGGGFGCIVKLLRTRSRTYQRRI